MYSIVYIYHIFFIHSFIDGHLVFFHVLAVVNSATMNISNSNYSFVQIYAQEWDCWIIWQLYFYFFEEPPYCFPQWLRQLTFPPTMQEGSLFSTHCPAFVICRFFLMMAQNATTLKSPIQTSTRREKALQRGRGRGRRGKEGVEGEGTEGERGRREACFVGCSACCVQSLSRVQLSATRGLQPARHFCPWGFFRQEDCSGLPCPPPGNLSNPGIKSRSPALQADSLPLSHQRSPCKLLAMGGNQLVFQKEQLLFKVETESIGSSVLTAQEKKWLIIAVKRKRIQPSLKTERYSFC